MAEALEQLGITVWGTRIPVPKELQRLIDESANMSDESECENNNMNNDAILTGDYNDSESDADCCDIPSASELMSKSNTERLKHLNLDESKCIIDQNGDTAKLNLGVGNTVLQSDCRSLDLLFQNPSKDDKQSDLSQKNESALILQNSDSKQSVLQVLTSAPVYSFDELKINNQSCSHASIDKEDSSIDTTRVNLDITTMITLVSNITHGGCKYSFKEKILSLQAEEERQTPVLPELESYLEGIYHAVRTIIPKHKTEVRFYRIPD